MRERSPDVQAVAKASKPKAAKTCRAEATDVANAVLDGVDGILLGAETLRGKYPVESVVTVRRLLAAVPATLLCSVDTGYLTVLVSPSL